MKKTYVTTLPDHIGTFLRAGRVFAALGMNITRCSYNKAVDTNTMFIEAEGSEEQHEAARKQLDEIGYLQDVQDRNVVLLEFTLKDVPGTVVGVLELIAKYSFNITYISSQEDGSGLQHFKMGLFVDDPEGIQHFMEAAEDLCEVRVIDYDHSEKVYDNSIFYDSFVSEITHGMGLGREAREALLVDANLAMQTLDENGRAPHDAFDNISRFARLLAQGRGENFAPRITREQLTGGTEIILIEPPCGSNTAILHGDGEYLFIDTGYACYRTEMLKIFHELIPDFDKIRKTVLVSHADVDHCGLLDIFDEVLASGLSAECLRLEYEGRDGFRERNPLHKPYIGICKTLTSYGKVDPEKVHVMWESPRAYRKMVMGRFTGNADEKLRITCDTESCEPIIQTGFFDFSDLHFEVYEGAGGHLPGENILIDYRNKIVFSGDVFVNIKGMTPQQAAYNKCAPVLMTSVDTDPRLCAAERKAMMDRLGTGTWRIYGAHGAKYEYALESVH
jgi:glyoxylase-like metal-dependent hydrolase (beta-lactamase superfamily II)/predicted amino acid-binding ACT domain protein